MADSVLATGAEVAASQIQEAADVYTALLSSDVAHTVAAAAELVLLCYREHGKVLVLGNGGSAAQAEHLAAELVGRYRRERRPLGAVALVESGPLLTAIGNDYGYERSFSRQVTALARPGDVVIALTTSGQSPNVIDGLRCARGASARTVVLCGEQCGPAAGLADISVRVPAKSTPRIQEAHELIIHILCELVESGICAEQE